MPMSAVIHEAPVLMLGIVVAALLSEDSATFGAAALGVSGMLDSRLAFVSVFTGLWVGDLGVYFAARFASSRKEGRLARWLAKHRPSSGGTMQRQRWMLGISRFFPGTRLPAYIKAGTERMAITMFAPITAVSATLWILLIFAFFRIAPSRTMMAQKDFSLLGVIVLLLSVATYFWKSWVVAHREKIDIFSEKLRRWEFWPPCFFYAPIVLFCIWFSLRYRGIALPAIANLNQRNGGLVGESKFEILSDLLRSSPEWTVETHLISEGAFAKRIEQVKTLMRRPGMDFPFVLKPDTAQRGAGFAKVRSEVQLAQYLRKVPSTLIMQRYVEGPREAGIFYYRFPDEPHGHIFGITRKEFPVLTGDGVSTIRQLVERDERARFLAKTYTARFRTEADRVPEKLERIRLVEAGNHCQGCIFEDGCDLYSEALRKTFDEISRRLPGFYIGRYDVRYLSDEEFLAGKGFTIIELNGAGSEATNIYDAKNSILRAYRTLYQQWQLAYAIGAANRATGIPPISVWDVWRDWRDFAAKAYAFPLAD